MAKRKTTKTTTKKEPSDEEILRAREVLREYHHPNVLNRALQIKLVEMYYPDIGGVLISRLPADQLYRIAEARFLYSCRVHENPTSYEKPLVGRINQLKAEKDADKREELAERLCIELENEPDDSYLGRMLDRALNRREEVNFQ